MVRQTLGTDEASLIEILVTRSNAQRVEIRKKYKTMFGKDLMNDLKSELSGNLEECLLAMMEPRTLYDAKCLRRAMRVGLWKKLYFCVTNQHLKHSLQTVL